MLDRKDNFGWLKSLASPLNRLLEGELNLIFYCGIFTSANANVTKDSEEKLKANVLDFYVVKNGYLKKNETLSFLSKKYVAHLLNEFNLTQYLERKYPLSEANGKKDNKSENSELTSFIQLTLQVKSDDNLKKESNKHNNDVKNQQEKRDKALKNSFLKKSKKEADETKGLSTEPELNLKETKATSHILNSNITEENNTMEIENQSPDTIEDQSEIPNKTEIKEQEQEHSQILNKENNHQNQSKQEESKEATIDNYSGLDKEHSLKTVTQLKRVSESQRYSSFLEKESLSFSDAVENSRIILLPNKNSLFSLAEIKQNHNSFFNFIDVFKDYESSANRPVNRFSRFIFALFIVLISSLLCFLFIKYSIDWATKSKSELNSLQDRENREILEEINKNHNLIRFN